MMDCDCDDCKLDCVFAVYNRVLSKDFYELSDICFLNAVNDMLGGVSTVEDTPFMIRYFDLAVIGELPEHIAIVEASKVFVIDE